MRNAVRLSLLCLFVCLNAHAATEYPLSVPVPGPSPYAIKFHALVADGVRFLLVTEEHGNVSARIVNAQGQQVSAATTFAAGSPRSLSAAWTGSHYVILMQRQSTPAVLEGVLLDREARVLREIRTVAAWTTGFQLSVSRKTILVMAVDRLTSSFDTINSSAAILLDFNLNVLRRFTIPYLVRAIASDGDRHMAFTQRRESNSTVISAVAIDDAGQAASPRITAGTPYPFLDSNPMQALFDGKRYMLLYGTPLQLVRVTPEGVGERNVPTGMLNEEARAGSVGGDRGIVIGRSATFSNDILVTSYNDTVRFIDPRRLERNVTAVLQAIAGTNGSYLSVWSERLPGGEPFGLALVPLTDGGALPPGETIARLARDQRESAARQLNLNAASGGPFVVWEETADRVQRVMFRRVGALGDYSAPRVVWQSQSSQYLPRIAFSGDRSLVVWNEDGGRLFGMRLSSDGTRLDTKPLALGFPDYRPQERNDGDDRYTPATHRNSPHAVVWDGSRYLVAYATRTDLRLTGVEHNGTVLPTRVVASLNSTPEGSPSAPAMASTPEGTFLVWQDGEPAPTTPLCGTLFCRIIVPASIRAIRIGRDGAPLDPRPFNVTAEAFNVRPSATYDGRNVVIAWTRMEDASTPLEGGLYARRYLPTGAAIDQDPLLIARDLDVPIHSATADGGDVVFAWRRNFDIEAARLRRDGSVNWPAVVSSGTPSSHSQPVVWRAPWGALLFGYTDTHADQVAAGVHRVVYTTAEAGMPVPPRRRTMTR